MDLNERVILGLLPWYEKNTSKIIGIRDNNSFLRFHAFGLTILTGVLCKLYLYFSMKINSTIFLAGALAKIVILPKFEESLFLNCIEYNRCNILFLVPVSIFLINAIKIIESFIVATYGFSCKTSHGTRI